MSIQICYALSTNGEPHYGDLLAISAQAVRRLYPGAKITILTDDQSWAHAKTLGNHLGACVRSAGEYRSDPRARSRFVKTQARSMVDGDFLYLDADTLPVARFDEIFGSEAPVGAALNRSRTNKLGAFPAEQAGYFERLAWPHPAPLYFNAGVVFWRDCPAARELAQSWHRNWRKFFEKFENPMDQAAFNYSIASLGIKPTIINNKFNYWPGPSREFGCDAHIYHFYAQGDELPEDTILDLLLEGYRESGRIDHSLIEAAAQRRHPWLPDVSVRTSARKRTPAGIAATTIEQLPAVPWMEPFLARWDAIEGLVAGPLRITTTTRPNPMVLTPTTTKGRHRLGIKVRGLDTDHVYRISAWLKASSPINIYLELRDDSLAHHGKASFKLHDNVAYGSDPDITAFGLEVEADEWTRIWAEMEITGEVAVAYVWLANSLGKTEFLGDSQTSISFGGLEIVKKTSEAMTINAPAHTRLTEPSISAEVNTQVQATKGQFVIRPIAKMRRWVATLRHFARSANVIADNVNVIAAQATLQSMLLQELTARVRSTAIANTQVSSSTSSDRGRLRTTQERAPAEVWPVTEIPYPIVDLALVANPVPGILEAPEFSLADNFFKSNPAIERSLVSSRSQALLYCLVRNLRPNSIFEIGTYQAGTSEAMCRALHANGHGRLHTTEPFSDWAVANILEQWPAELRRHILFRALDSMTFYDKMAKLPEERPSLVFIDGNHDFEYAAFDIQSAARSLTLGGFIVVDNIAQPGPYFASREFLTNNMGWTECGAIDCRYDSAKPFDPSRGGIPGTELMILRAPRHHMIGRRPVGFPEIVLVGRAPEGIELDPGPGVGKGILHAQCIARGFSSEKKTVETSSNANAEIGAEHGSVSIRLSLPIDLDPNTFEQIRVETWLSWTGEQPLSLLCPPRVF